MLRFPGHGRSHPDDIVIAPLDLPGHVDEALEVQAVAFGLGPDEVARNHALSLRRRAVEKLFGTLKRSYGFTRVPSFNLARNATALALACFAFNLRRWHAIATP